jgi:hypothetical protein
MAVGEQAAGIVARHRALLALWNKGRKLDTETRVGQTIGVAPRWRSTYTEERRASFLAMMPVAAEVDFWVGCKSTLKWRASAQGDHEKRLSVRGCLLTQKLLAGAGLALPLLLLAWRV